MAERDEVWRGPCPCGDGEVAVTRVDYDKMYVPDDWFVSCFCSVCSEAYRFDSRRGRTTAWRKGGAGCLVLKDGRWS